MRLRSTIKPATETEVKKSLAEQGMNASELRVVDAVCYQRIGKLYDAVNLLWNAENGILNLKDYPVNDAAFQQRLVQSLDPEAVFTIWVDSLTVETLQTLMRLFPRCKIHGDKISPSHMWALEEKINASQQLKLKSKYGAPNSKYNDQCITITQYSAPELKQEKKPSNAKKMHCL